MLPHPTSTSALISSMSAAAIPAYVRHPTTITLQQRPDAARGTGNIDHFGFHPAHRRQLDRAIEELIAAGATLLERREHQPGSPYTFVTLS